MRCVGVGWGEIIINVVVALKGVFEEPCSMSPTPCVGVGLTDQSEKTGFHFDLQS